MLILFIFVRENRNKIEENMFCENFEQDETGKWFWNMIMKDGNEDKEWLSSVESIFAVSIISLSAVGTVLVAKKVVLVTSSSSTRSSQVSLWSS